MLMHFGIYNTWAFPKQGLGHSDSIKEEFSRNPGYAIVPSLKVLRDPNFAMLK
jgi:hypothetical protein